MLVDHEKVVQRLKELLVQKPHHGTKELLAELGRLEAECAVEEGLPEKALRLYGVVLSDDLLKAVSSDGPKALAPHEEQADGPDTDPSTGGDPVAATKEEACPQEQEQEAPPPSRTPPSSSPASPTPTMSDSPNESADSKSAARPRRTASREAALT